MQLSSPPVMRPRRAPRSPQQSGRRMTINKGKCVFKKPQAQRQRMDSATGTSDCRDRAGSRAFLWPRGTPGKSSTGANAASLLQHIFGGHCYGEGWDPSIKAACFIGARLHDSWAGACLGHIDTLISPAGKPRSAMITSWPVPPPSWLEPSCK